MNQTNPESEPFPTGITVEKESRTVQISWDSGDSTVISWTTLRLNCPCAQCQGEDMAHSVDRDRILKTSSETELANVTLAGHYAIQPTWASGHDMGFYPWQLLRHLGLQDDAGEATP